MCGRKQLLILEGRKVTVICTLDLDHTGDHYDSVFNTGWMRSHA